MDVLNITVAGPCWVNGQGLHWRWVGLGWAGLGWVVTRNRVGGVEEVRGVAGMKVAGLVGGGWVEQEVTCMQACISLLTLTLYTMHTDHPLHLFALSSPLQNISQSSLSSIPFPLLHYS
jgi:hypothetical protein